MRTTYLHHVTLVTGDTRRSLLAEVQDEIVSGLWPLLSRALTGERVSLPAPAGYTMSGGVDGQCCAITIWSADGPLVTLGVAGHSRCSGALWRRLHEMQLLVPTVTDPSRPPPTPWCGVVLRPALLDSEAVSWLGDLERCLAWAWLERPRPS